MQVTAAVLRAGDAPFSIEELELGEPRADEALVRMVAVGVCHTDLLARELPPEFFAGPVVNGHEGAGVVEAVGADVRGVAPGDHVVLSFNSDGTCPACAVGRPAGCRDFRPLNTAGARLDGSTSLTDAAGERVGSHFFGQSSFATHAVVSSRSLVKVDPSYDLATLGPLGCGIQTGAGAVLNTLGVTEGSSFVAAGVGSLGLAAVMAAELAGAERIIAVDRHANRLELARRYGATDTLSVAPEELAAAITDLTGGGADFAFDSTGHPGVVRAVFDGLNSIGTLGVAGVHLGELTLDYGTVLSPRTLKGVIEGDAVPQEFIPHLAALNAEGRFPFDELITTYAFAEIDAAEAASASGEVIKPVLLFD